MDEGLLKRTHSKSLEKLDKAGLIIFRTQKFDITMLYSSKQPNTADENFIHFSCAFL